MFVMDSMNFAVECNEGALGECLLHLKLCRQLFGNVPKHEATI